MTCFFLFQVSSKNSNNFESRSLFSAIISNSASTVARTIVSCSKSAHARGAVREPRAMVIGSCLPMGGHLFLNNLLRPFFHSKLQFWTKHVSQMDPKWGLLGPTFQKKCENEKVCLDCAGAYGLHMSPSLEALNATQKSKKKYMFQVSLFSPTISNICGTWPPKGVQMW